MLCFLQFMLNYITFKDIPKIFKILGGGGGASAFNL